MLPSNLSVPRGPHWNKSHSGRSSVKRMARTRAIGLFMTGFGAGVKDGVWDGVWVCEAWVAYGLGKPVPRGRSEPVGARNAVNQGQTLRLRFRAHCWLTGAVLPPMAFPQTPPPRSRPSLTRVAGDALSLRESRDRDRATWGTMPMRRLREGARRHPVKVIRAVGGAFITLVHGADCGDAGVECRSAIGAAVLRRGGAGVRGGLAGDAATSVHADRRRNTASPIAPVYGRGGCVTLS
jgi:hypothetical protein